jgi:hypothetical protein
MPSRISVEKFRNLKPVASTDAVSKMSLNS